MYSGLCGTLSGLCLPCKPNGEADRLVLVYILGYPIVLALPMKPFGLTKQHAKSATYVLVRLLLLVPLTVQ